MNNLKRVLSLALSGVMLVGMMAVGASAAEFVDADKIQHNDAVNILVALKVINGKDDGSHFDPEGDVTRAEMAKMIAVAMNGGTDTNTGVKGTASFTDIKGHWAESYIEYCYDLGIISGRGDGTFDPNGNVTGLEATKMVLTALGYDSTAYRLTGSAWAVRTDELARAADPNLYEDLGGVAMSVKATRDTAAQLIWNGLQNITKRVTPNTNTSTGEVTWTYGDGKGTMLKERYNADIWVGTFDGNYYTGDTTVKGEIAVTGALSGKTGSTTAKLPSDFDISNIGEEVKVIFKDGNTGTKNEPDAKDTIYGVFNTGAAKTVTGVLADVKDNESDKAQINIGGTKYDLATSETSTDAVVTVIVNYANQVDRTSDVLAANGAMTYTTAQVKGTSSANSKLTDDLKKATGDTIKAVIDPDTSKITTIYVTTSKLAAVTAINSSKITLNNNVGSLDIDDNDIEEGLKKGDIVTVSSLYKAKATDDDAYTIVKKAETASGEVDGYKAKETVTVDGTKYNVYNKAAFGLTNIPDEDKVITSFDGSLNTYIGEEVTLYMVNGYVGAAIQTSESANNYSLVTEVKTGTSSGSAFGGLQLQVMDSEGTKTIITVSEDSPSGKTTSDYTVGDIVTYTVNKKNEAEVKVEGEIEDKVGAYDDSVKTFGEKGQAGVVTSANCVLFVQTENVSIKGEGDKIGAFVSGAKYKAYNIRDLKSLESNATNKGMTTVVNKDGKVVAAFINYAAGKNPAGATDNTVYGIVSAVGGRVKDYFTYTVKANGEECTVNSKDSTFAAGDLVYFEQSRDDNYAAGEVKKVVAGADVKVVWTKEAEKDTLTFFNGVVNNNGFVGVDQETLAMEKDAPIVYVDKDAKDSTAEGNIGAFDSVTGYANAIIMTETTGTKTTIIAVFVETSNEKDIGTVSRTANAADIKKLDDGLYTLAAGTTTDLSSSKPVESLLIFKFTAKKAEAHTLTIKDTAATPATVYAETSNALTDGTAYIFYVSTKGATTSAGGTVGTPLNGELAAGSYTYEIKNASNEVVLSGSFTK